MTKEIYEVKQTTENLYNTINEGLYGIHDGTGEDTPDVTLIAYRDDEQFKFYVVTSDGTVEIYRQEIDETEARRLIETRNAEDYLQHANFFDYDEPEEWFLF